MSFFKTETWCFGVFHLKNSLDWAQSDTYFEQIKAIMQSVEYKMYPSWLHSKVRNHNIHTSEAAEQTDDQVDHKESQEGPLGFWRAFYTHSRKPICKL